MTNLKQRVREILEGLQYGTFAAVRSDSAVTIDDEQRARSKDVAEQAIYDLMLEVVGEDADWVYRAKKTSTANKRIRYQNQVRDSLRQLIKGAIR